jgi:hypothetical protein
MNTSQKNSRAGITALFIAYMIVSILFLYCCLFIFMSLAAIVLAIITQIVQRSSQIGVEFAQPWFFAICLILVLPLYFLHRYLRERYLKLRSAGRG